MSRAELRDKFLAGSGWGDAAISPLAGDASNRRYDRLVRPDGTKAVLMDAPPEKGEDTRPFIHVAQHLSGLGLSAPAILAANETHGFLVIEDLGDGLYARLLETDPTQEEALYRLAVDALITLHKAPLPSGITDYHPALLAKLAGLAFEWYRPAATGAEFDATDLLTELETQLAAIWPTNPVLALRDYHAENLLFLPDRQGAAQVGLLDFQDAQACHPAYDLVSLIEDARRDVTEAAREAAITHYVVGTGCNEAELRRAIGLCGLQRNLRILGVFARLHLRDGKPHYLDLLPRVWGHLERDFAAVTEADLGARFRAALPEPTAEIIVRIKAAP